MMRKNVMLKVLCDFTDRMLVRFRRGCRRREVNRTLRRFRADDNFWRKMVKHTLDIMADEE